MKMMKITSKKQTIQKTKWLRKKIDKWMVVYKKIGRLAVDPKEKKEVMGTLREVENFIFDNGHLF
jgi:hypothetical protein